MEPDALTWRFRSVQPSGIDILPVPEGWALVLWFDDAESALADPDTMAPWIDLADRLDQRTPTSLHVADREVLIRADHPDGFLKTPWGSPAPRVRP